MLLNLFFLCLLLCFEFHLAASPKPVKPSDAAFAFAKVEIIFECANKSNKELLQRMRICRTHAQKKQGATPSRVLPALHFMAVPPSGQRFTPLPSCGENDALAFRLPLAHQT